EAVDENLPVLAEGTAPDLHRPADSAEVVEAVAVGEVVATAETAIETAASVPSELALAERNGRGVLWGIAATAGPIDLVTEILGRACDCRATDVHFDPQEAHTRVRYRIDGQLHDVLDLETVQATSVVSRLKVMANLNIVERRHAQDGRITIRHKD